MKHIIIYVFNLLDNACKYKNEKNNQINTKIAKKFLKKYRYAMPNILHICKIKLGLVKNNFKDNLIFSNKFFGLIFFSGNFSSLTKFKKAILIVKT